MILQFCGLSGAGKTTLAHAVRKQLLEIEIPAEIIDGDLYRSKLCKDLGFSRADREENLLRLGFLASRFSGHGIVSIMSVINPFDDVRKKLARSYPHVKTIFVDCPIQVLRERDTKGLYKRARLPDSHPDKIRNLTGVNDPFEIPAQPDLHINTGAQNISDCVSQILKFVLSNLPVTHTTKI